MNILLSLVPLVTMTCLLAAGVKLAARILRNAQITWKSSFIYALIIVGLTIGARILSFGLLVQV